jgi:Na+/H+ antiporter NhaC
MGLQHKVNQGPQQIENTKQVMDEVLITQLVTYLFVIVMVFEGLDVQFQTVCEVL